MDNLEHLDDGRCELDLLLDQRRVRVVNQVREWDRCKNFLRPMIRTLTDLGATLRVDDDINISIAGDKQKLTDVVRAMYEAGYRIQGSRPVAGDTAWSTFLYSDRCKLRLWFSFSSTICRRVKVGTQMVQQDVYETVCGEQIELPSPEEESLNGLLTSTS